MYQRIFFLYHLVLSKPWLFFTSCFLLLIFSGHLFVSVCPIILTTPVCDVQYFEPTETLLTIFVISVLFAPLLETLLFQYLPLAAYFRWCNSKTNTKQWMVTTIASVLFAVSHSYNILTVIDAFIAGLIFCATYLYFREKGHIGFWYTYLLHAAVNTYSFLIDDVWNI
jgi:hypothetical protein